MRPRPKGPEARGYEAEAEAKAEAEAEAKILASRPVCLEALTSLLFSNKVQFSSVRCWEVFKILLKILIEDLVFSIINTFTARRVCIARTMLSQDVCLSVRRTPVLSLNGYTYHQSFFHRRLSPPF